MKKLNEILWSLGNDFWICVFGVIAVMAGVGMAMYLEAQ
jgi:hypothetical protein